MQYFGIAIAFVAGIFMTLQGSINGMIGQKVGLFPTILVSVSMQFLTFILIVAVKRDIISGVISLNNVNYGFFFIFIAALLGLSVLFTTTYAIMDIGPLMAFSIIIFSQLFGSMIIEHFGIMGMPHHPITIKRILALVLMVIAARLFMK